VIQVQVGKNIIDDVLIDGGFGININTENLKIQLGFSKQLGFIRDLKIFFHGIPYMVTFTIINSNILDFNYSMLFGCPWLRNAKVSHNWGTNIVTIQGIGTTRTMFFTNKLGIQTKKQ